MPMGLSIIGIQTIQYPAIVVFHRVDLGIQHGHKTFRVGLFFIRRKSKIY